MARTRQRHLNAGQLAFIAAVIAAAITAIGSILGAYISKPLTSQEAASPPATPEKPSPPKDGSPLPLSSAGSAVTPWIFFQSVSNTDRFRPNFSIDPPRGSKNIKVTITGDDADQVRLNLREEKRGWGPVGVPDKNLFENLTNGSIFPANRYQNVFWQISGIREQRKVDISLDLVPDTRPFREAPSSETGE